MIHFTDTHEKKDISDIVNSPAIKEILPDNLSSSDSRDFWDNFFTENPYGDGEEPNYDTIWPEIFDRDEGEFTFVFPFDDEVSKVLNRFDEGEWSQLTTAERLEAMRTFVELLAAKLGLEEVPEIILFDGPAYLLGAFVEGDDNVEINKMLLKNPNALVNTLAHEMRHAYQYEHAMNPQYWTDILYRINFDNYITPEMSFEDYQDQLVEAEARAFAKLFAPKEAE